jgi:DNA-binding NtrC family response regulator
VVRLEIPPLRERRSDIPLLVESFLRGIKSPRRAVSEEAMDRLMGHPWPGNVRELRHVLERACVMSSAEVLDVEDFDFGQTPEPSTAPASDLDLRRNLEVLERQLIQHALERAHGNRAEASRLLGIRRALLYARMKALGWTAEADRRPC